jgi:hypothetical protein
MVPVYKDIGLVIQVDIANLVSYGPLFNAGSFLSGLLTDPEQVSSFS